MKKTGAVQYNICKNIIIIAQPTQEDTTLLTGGQEITINDLKVDGM